MKIPALHFGFAAVLFSIVLAGCGKDETSQHSEESTVASGPALRVDASTSGSIVGSVTLDGVPPKFAPIDMSGEPNCRNDAPVFPQTVVTGKNGELANVVIYVKSGLGNYHFDPPTEPVVLDQKGCMYEPHIVALMVNQSLQIRNDDATIHNVHSEPKTNAAWNRSQTPGTPPLETSFPKPELAISIECNVHPWMRSYMFVFSHPYYAVTSTAGTFELKNLPSGTYTIEAWQEKYGVRDQTVTIGAKESKPISFVFNSTDSRVR